MSCIRFMVVGYRDDKGYGVKDLEDECVEYFDEYAVIEMSKKVKIYGVEGNKIDLDWFKIYYSKCVMPYGELKAIEFFNLFVNSDGKFDYVSEFSHGFQISSKDYHYKFIEFLENPNIAQGFGVVEDELMSYLSEHNSTLFHVNIKVSNRFFELDSDTLCRLDIKNILADGATIVNTIKRAKIYNLSMKDIRYKFNDCKIAFLVNVPNDSSVILDFDKLSDNKLFVSKDFNLDSLTLFDSCNLFCIYLEDLGMKPRLIYKFPFLRKVRFDKCKFIYKDSDFRVSYDKY